jgi:hypothetical protein
MSSSTPALKIQYPSKDAVQTVLKETNYACRFFCTPTPSKIIRHILSNCTKDEKKSYPHTLPIELN